MVITAGVVCSGKVYIALLAAFSTGTKNGGYVAVCPPFAESRGTDPIFPLISWDLIGLILDGVFVCQKF